MMKCLRCQSDDFSKNGFHQGKQKYVCKSCGRQWIGDRQPRGYPQSVRDLCLTMYRNGLDARMIGQYTGISYNTIINWVKRSQQQRPPSIATSAKDDRAAADDPPDFITSLEPPNSVVPRLSR